MNSKELISKVMRKMGSKKISSELKFTTAGVEAEYLQNYLNSPEAEMLDKLKEYWNLGEIDIQELDWDWEPVTISWEAYFPRSSGVLNVSLKAPDPTIMLEGKLTYWDDAIKKDLTYSYLVKMDLKNIEVITGKLNLDSDIAPEILSYENKKFKLIFGQ